MTKEYYYSRTWLNQVNEAYEKFYKKNQLQYCEGANEPGCPPNYVRSKTPRKKDAFGWFGKKDSINPKGKVKDQGSSSQNPSGQEEEMVP